MKKNNYKLTLIRPGGNDQLLIEGLVKKENRKIINKKMIERFPNVEQVSFYEFDKEKNIARLELAGGEFCGNATRSLAYLLLNGKLGEVLIQVSGTKQLLTAGVKKTNTAFAQMPIFAKNQKVKKITDALFRVDLEGITQIVCISDIKNKTKSDLKNFAKKILEKENLLYSVPAAGVMFVKKQLDEFVIQPIVWVRDIETLLYETSCASGTAAVALWYAKNKRNTTEITVKQPSKSYITATVKKMNGEFIELLIDGPIKIISEERIMYE